LSAGKTKDGFLDNYMEDVIAEDKIMADAAFLEGVGGTGRDTTTTAETRLSGGTEDQDRFLKLLMEQLKNQDPMSPMSSENFMGQMAQLTSVEKLTEISSKLDTLTQNSESSQLLDLLGFKIEVEATDGRVLSGQAESVTFTEDGAVLDVAGETINSEEILKIGLPEVE
jgi:flagellar basal-body rod modification protein FlgD